MLSTVFSKKIASEILAIANATEDDRDYLLKIVRAYNQNLYPKPLDAKIAALLDLQNAMTSQVKMLPVVDQPEVAARDLLKHSWGDKEQFIVMALDIKHRVLGIKIVSAGTASECLAHPREIFRPAIAMGASRVIIAHNHPSGNLEASPEDIQLTRQLIDAGSILGIPVLDHPILGWGKWESMRESDGTRSLWQ